VYQDGTRTHNPKKKLNLLGVQLGENENEKEKEAFPSPREKEGENKPQERREINAHLLLYCMHVAATSRARSACVWSGAQRSTAKTGRWRTCVVAMSRRFRKSFSAVQQ
jgi:hypothetical protein